MPDKLEEAALSGELFRGGDQSLSEYREEDRDTPSPTNTDDELGSDLDSFDPVAAANAAGGGAGGGGTQQSSRTGPKGVLQDQRAALEGDRVAQIIARRRGNEQLEGKALLGATWAEDDALRKDADDDEARAREAYRERRRWEAMESAKHEGRRGFLREVSLEGYLNAVDDEGWTVMLVYEASLPSIPSLISSLQSLAAQYPPPAHSFLLARASTLSFSLLPSGEPDLVVLPTLLVYDGQGELVENWVRVDLMLDRSREGLSGLLASHGVIRPSQGSRKNDSDDAMEDSN